jgi:hypothetical protein
MTAVDTVALLARRVDASPAPEIVAHRGFAVTPMLRLVLAASMVLAFLLGQMAGLAGLRLAGQLATSAFLYVGPGVAFCLLLRPGQRHMFLLLSLVVGPSIVTLVATVVALTGVVSLSTTWVVLAAVTLAVLVYGGVRGALDLRAAARSGPSADPATAEQPSWSRRPVLTTVLALGGLTLSVVAAAAHHGDPRPQGAALTAGPLWFIGALLVLVAVLLAWRRGTGLALPVLSLSSIVVASQGAMYREPTVVVAARHIGLVDYILVHGRLDRSTDIYQAWAGLFASAALNVRATGLSDLFGYAAWWGVLATPVMVLAVRCLAAAFLDDRRAWLAALLFGLGSSLNTSFFAPQVLGFVMAVTVAALLATPASAPGALSLRARIGTAVLLSLPLALTHQISPYMLTLALMALAAFRLVRPWWGFVIIGAPAVAWALVNRHLLNSYMSSSAFGQLLDNLAPPENSVGVSPVPLANRVTFLLPAAALVVIGLVALLVLARSRTRLTWGLACAAGSPVLLMAGTSYGQEGIFRVALFALPWLAILACTPPRVGRRVVPRWMPTDALARLGRPALFVGLGALFVVNVVGLTGMDWARVIRRGDVSATQWVERTAPRGSLVLTLGTDLTMPTDSNARYAEVDWVSRGSLVKPPTKPYPTSTGAAYDAQADLATLTRRLTAERATRYYAVVADSMGAYDHRYGNQRYSDHELLVAAIADSERWRLVHSAPGMRVYRLRGSAR